jgi:hypothetical protein
MNSKPFKYSDIEHGYAQPAYHGLDNIPRCDGNGRPYKSLKFIGYGETHEAVSATVDKTILSSPGNTVAGGNACSTASEE